MFAHMDTFTAAACVLFFTLIAVCVMAAFLCSRPLSKIYFKDRGRK